GGGFLVVPALVLALALPMEYAVGTSLVVVVLTSAAALAVRAGSVVQPDWWLVLALTGASAVGGYAGARVADRTDTRKLSGAFTVLVLMVAVYTAVRALPALI
ncbi:MAG: sulfite exporter TauE/SafE family protein, partial [Nocardioidaceae bacterium]|nr:sulfite exporter TauE/SafE family protein [Nocardioidaceae bacterium]